MCRQPKKRYAPWRTADIEVGRFYYYRHRVISPHPIDGELLKASRCLLGEIDDNALYAHPRYQRLEGNMQLALPEGVSYGGDGPIARGNFVNSLAVLLPNTLEVHLEHRDPVEAAGTSEARRHIAVVIPERDQCVWGHAMQQRASFLSYYRAARSAYQGPYERIQDFDEQVQQRIRELSARSKSDLLVWAKEAASRRALRYATRAATKEMLLTFLVFVYQRELQGM